MQPDTPVLSLSKIDTRWSLVQRAYRDQGDAGSSARLELMIRYAGAVHRYLLRVSNDPEIANDLAQEFALRFLRGDFHRADPSRGRFRNYVKAAVLNLLADSQRQRRRQPRALPGDGEGLSDPSAPEPNLDLDRQFLDCWRDEVLRRAWELLERYQKETRRPYFTVLRFRAEHPALRSHEIAERLSVVFGKAVSGGWVRQTLRRARKEFSEFVRAEVSRSLINATSEELDDELRDLGLLTYCRDEGNP